MLKNKSIRIIVLILVVIVIGMNVPYQKNLILTSQGQVLEMVNLGKEKTFKITFRHSVNKGLVVEEYVIEPDNKFYLDTGLFESYGAGMLDEVPDDVTMTDDGKFLKLKFPKEEMTSVNYAAAGIADHVLEVGEKQFHLFKENPYKRITISVENKSLFQKIVFNLSETK